MANPLPGFPITQNYGCTSYENPYYEVRNGCRWHSGLDIGAPAGTPVVAAGSGRVIRAGDLGAYGLTVEIDHQNGYVTRYAHLSASQVSMGQSVTEGQQIGNVGSTGNSSGPHLHYEVRRGGIDIEPRFDVGGSAPAAGSPAGQAAPASAGVLALLAGAIIIAWVFG